jgi:dienelactone hydrolase
MFGSLRVLLVLALLIGASARAFAQDVPGSDATDADPSAEEAPSSAPADAGSAPVAEIPAERTQTPSFSPPPLGTFVPAAGEGWRAIPPPLNGEPLGGEPNGAPRLGPWRWFEVDAPEGHKLLVGALRPPGDGPFPVVVYLHGGAGFDRVVLSRAETKRLVPAGFMVVAGGWFASQNPNDEPRKWPIDGPQAPQFMALEGPTAATMPTFNLTAWPYAQAIVNVAGAFPAADPRRVAVLGDSRGGCQAILAGRLATVRAVVADSGDCYEGRTAKMTNAIAAQQLVAPLLYLHGTLDTQVPTDRIRDFEASLKQLNKPYELAVYPGSQHVVDGALNTAAVRVDARARTIAFLLKYLAN